MHAPVLMLPFRRSLRFCLLLCVVAVFVNSVSLSLIPESISYGLPLWLPDAGSFDVFVPCEVTGCLEYLKNIPPSLWTEVKLANVRVVLVLAGGRDALQKLTDSFLFPRNVVAVMLFDQSVPESRPPVIKELLMLRRFAWAAETPALFVKLDYDTVFSPFGLRSLVADIDATRNDVYHGRPVTSCECAQKELRCVHPRALTYCSGFMYVSTRATLRRVPKQSFGMVKNGTKMCLSSDWTVGSIMRSQLRQSCQPLVHRGSTPEEYSGYTWPLDHNDKKYTLRLPICQQIGSPGGIHDTHTISYPFFLVPSTVRRCVIAHPAKSAYDFQYMWNFLRDGADRPHPKDIRSHDACMAAVLILSMPAQFDSRQVIRLTWGASARSYGLQLKFVIGSSTILSLADVLLHENQTFGDLLVFDVEERYSNIAFKVGAGLQWLADHSSCRYILKTDMDTYLRPYQLIKSLEEIDVVQPAEYILMGHIWNGKKSGRPNVVKDPSNPWFINYTGDFYPPWASGYAFVLSMRLARLVAPLYVRTKIGTVEDLLVGLVVEKLQASGLNVTILHSQHFAYESDCTDRTVADNPVMTNEPYNILQRHEANIHNQFCRLGLRTFMAGRAYAPSVDVHSPSVVSGKFADHYLQVSIPPWREANSNDIFAFADPKQAEFSISKEPSASLRNSYATIRRMCTDCEVLVHQCVSCLEAWVVVLARNRQSGQFLFYQDFKLGINSEFSERVKALPSFDVGIPHGCLSNRLLTFAQRLRPLFLPHWRLITTLTTCDGVEQGRFSSAGDLAVWLATGSGLNLSQVLVIELPTFSRSSARNAIHSAARQGVVLCVFDTDMFVQSLFFDHAAMFVHRGRTVYFPVVFSEFDPQMVNIAAEFFRKPPAYDYQGKWRPYGHGNYAIHGEDAKEFWFDGSFRDWGGEDDEFFNQVRKRRNIVRLQDASIRHVWHAKNCSSAPAGMQEKCLAAMADYSGSPLSWFLATRNKSGFELPH